MNLKLFKKRLNDLYICWRKYNKDLWGNSDVLVIQTPPSHSSSNHCHPISSFFYFWLMGHDFPDTITIFTRDEIHFICNKKVSILQTLVGPAMEAVKAQVLIHGRDRGDDGLTMMDDIIRSVRVMYNANSDPYESRPFVVGYISGESPKSKLLWTCIKLMKPMEFRSASVNRGFSKLSKLFNHADQSLGNSNIESNTSHGNGKDIQMQSLPDDFEQRLSLGTEIKPRVADQLVPKIKELALEKENGGLEELKGDLSKYSLVSEEEDEWVLIEADEEEHQIKSNKKGLLGWTK